MDFIPSRRYSPPPVTKTAEHPNVRDRLLDAAERVVMRDGVGSLTLDAVAKEASVSKGGLLYHFPSKSALILAIVERTASRCEAEQQANEKRQKGDAGSFTRAYLATRAARVERVLDPRKNERPLHTALMAAAGTDPQYLDPFRDRLKCWQARLEKDGIDPVTATIVRLAIDGLGIGSSLGMPMPNAKLRRAVVKRLLEMIDQPGSQTVRKGLHRGSPRESRRTT